MMITKLGVVIGGVFLCFVAAWSLLVLRTGDVRGGL
jgi:hypothetical protein